jgi:hypothetical protein
LYHSLPDGRLGQRLRLRILLRLHRRGHGGLSSDDDGQHLSLALNDARGPSQQTHVDQNLASCKHDTRENQGE